MFVDIEYISLLLSSQEIAALKEKSWASKETQLMIVTLKLSPDGDLSGTIISSSVFLPTSLPRLSDWWADFYPLLSGFYTAKSLNTRTARKNAYLSQPRKTSCRLNPTSPFTSTSGRKYFPSHYPVRHNFSGQEHFIPLFLLSTARHLVGMALCLTSHVVRRGMKSRAISLCLRMWSKASFAPK